MAKKKIKTARYFTRNCENCGFEMANWFVQCPRCKQTWNAPAEEEQLTTDTNQIVQKSTSKLAEDTQKTIRIIAQLTEDDIKINGLSIFFSANNGVSWFSMPMKREEGYFVAEIENIALYSTIVYYLKGIDETGMEFVEDNESNFFYYNVSEIEDEQDPLDIEPPTQIKEPPQEIPNKIEGPIIIDGPVSIEPPKFEEPLEPPKFEEPKISKTPVKNPGVIFTPLNQAKKESNLKVCSHCKSKIKTDWSVCPICGGQQ